MAPRSFLSLPCELRQMIYKYYFPTNQGYHFNPTSRKLTVAHGEPIDIALMYACRLVAEETKEMPFLYNDISFKTFYQQDLSAWLCRFDRLVKAQFQEQAQLLLQLCPFVTPEIQLRIQERFPWFATHLSVAFIHYSNTALPRGDPWEDPFNSASLHAVVTPPANEMFIDICPNDRAHSAHRAAIEFTLRLLCETSDKQFIDTVNEILVGWEYSGGARLSNFLDRCYEPWRFPSLLSDLDEMGHRLGDHKAWASMTSWETSRRHNMQYRPLYRFSAVSAAIGFLNALPINKRSSLRNIIIHEDRISAGYSDGHAIGLIPFCQENGQLRIRHKFSMVRNLFERAYVYQNPAFDRIQDQKEKSVPEVIFRVTSMGLYPIITNCLAEAMYLPDAGMPDGSYTLLLDGEDAGDLCSEIFQQGVLDKEAKRLVLNRALKEDPNSDWAKEYSYEIMLCVTAHAGALKHLVNKTSFFESNFYPGHLNKVDALTAHYRMLGMRKCAEELVLWGRLHAYDSTSFSHVPEFGPMLRENFECRKLAEYRPITHRRTYVDGAIDQCL
ncbi:hypothetical protein FPHYL_2596 [Fusarium phyllophilum]|uniref:Uncharacterized protein n=1 Tax=Fusarium phyllophilum TaxID=47803 RepID=A0A8H5KB04_9HYPO|nr:hypothetical protein FPHYL_2596 [Fusarium phyllophilum]